MVDAHASLKAAAAKSVRDTQDAPPEARADALEQALAVELDRLAVRSVLYDAGDVDPTEASSLLWAPGQRLLMGQDPRLKPMPARPTLVDFFKLRFAPAQHLLQSAALAQEAGHDEKIVLACLLHDISHIGFLRPDHGYWGAQLIEPYVEEEVSWAVRHHQALRFFPDASVGYEYPQMYVEMFGADYRPPAHVRRAYEQARAHRWYMSARLICLNDVYAFDPNKKVSLDAFVDVIGRHFRQPAEGLGYDDSASAHMWRTIIAPTRAL